MACHLMIAARLFSSAGKPTLVHFCGLTLTNARLENKILSHGFMKRDWVAPMQRVDPLAV